MITDGSLLFDPTGREWKRFHVHDGLAMVAARRAGLPVAVVSGRTSPAVARRMAELGVDELHQGVADKAPVVRAIIGRLGLLPAQVAAMGDDLPDLPVMEMVGLRLAPASAVREVRRAAHWVSRRAAARAPCARRSRCSCGLAAPGRTRDELRAGTAHPPASERGRYCAFRTSYVW